MDVVFSLQRAGSDAVFSYQFPVAVSAPVRRPGGGVLDIPRVERPGLTAQEIAQLLVPLFELGVFDA